MDIQKVLKSLNRYTLKKGFSYLKQYGLQEFLVRLSERFEEAEVDYSDWCKSDVLTEQEKQRQRDEKWKDPPVISVVVPVFSTPERYLREMIESVTGQTYPHWELCIADGSPDVSGTKAVIGQYLDDKRIHYRILDQNLGISGNTNAAIEMASGDYIALFDHDDLLRENALYEVAKTAVSSDADIIYTDEDKIKGDTGERFQPNFKPDFNLDLLRANNYICHLLVVRNMTGPRITISFCAAWSRQTGSPISRRSCTTGAYTRLLRRIIRSAKNTLTTQENGQCSTISGGAGKKRK